MQSDLCAQAQPQYRKPIKRSQRAMFTHRQGENEFTKLFLFTYCLHASASDFRGEMGGGEGAR